VVTVAYLANLFPSPVEPYVGAEIEELRRRGVDVIAGSVRRPEGREWASSADRDPADRNSGDPDWDFVVLQPLGIGLLARAAWMCLRRWRRIADLIERVVFQGQETPAQRVKALLHTWLGACYALRLQKREVQHLHVDHINVHHIHVHHGYFGAWVAMVAARLLNVGYSMTLHGSDLLTHAAYLDAKLKHCRFCVTISEYNRAYILEHYPGVEAGKVIVARLGVDVPEPAHAVEGTRAPWDSRLRLLAVGRLHAVKDHAFLLRACVQLCQRGLDFQCEIAGEGPERGKLEGLIREYAIEERVKLLGHVPREQLGRHYQMADVVVLTSRSEGIPVALMEAMARGKIVLAPAITGIPELVVEGQTGFLYEPGSVEDFVKKILWLDSLTHESSSLVPGVAGANRLDWARYRAREQVRRHFNRGKNLESFGNLFLERVLEAVLERAAGLRENSPHEDPLLQQI
jgi:glycosyltransferase involved in cell wall biosynthesis